MNIQKINFSTKNYLGNFKGNTINNQKNQNEKYQEYLPTSSIPTETIKAYSPYTQESKVKLDNLTIVKYENDDGKPYFTLIKNYPDIRHLNKGVSKVYAIAQNIQFYDTKSYKVNPENTFYELSDSDLTLRIFAEEEDFSKYLSSFKKDFLPAKLDKKYISEALLLAPAVLYVESKQPRFISRSSLKIGDDYEKYINLIKNVSIKDVEDYHKAITASSSYYLALCLDEDFYKQNEKEIFKSINENFEITNIKYEQRR